MESSRSPKYPSLASAFGASSNLLPIQAVRLPVSLYPNDYPPHQDWVVVAAIRLYTPAAKIISDGIWYCIKPRF
jgi:hypothetical protein